MASLGRLTGMVSRTCQQSQITVPCKLLAQRSLVTEAGCPQKSKLLCQHNASNHGQGSHLLFQQRFMSNKNFIQKVIDEFKADLKKSKEMKDSIKKFKEETKKLEDSDALKQARKKFETIEEETIKGSSAVKKTLDGIKEKVSEISEEAQKQEYVKKGIDLTSSAASKTKESVVKTGQAIADSDAFGKIT